MTVVLDIGCATIESGRKVHESRDVLIERFKPQLYYGFDPQVEPHYGTLYHGRDRVTIVQNKPWAAWTRDGKVGWQQRAMGLSSFAAEGDDAPQVPCFDMSAFILRLPEDVGDVVLKLDCEGAEYVLLATLLATDAHRRVSQVLVDWHDDHDHAFSRQEIEDGLYGAGILIELWP